MDQTWKKFTIKKISWFADHIFKQSCYQHQDIVMANMLVLWGCLHLQASVLFFNTKLNGTRSVPLFAVILLHLPELVWYTLKLLKVFFKLHWFLKVTSGYCIKWCAYNIKLNTFVKTWPEINLFLIFFINKLLGPSSYCKLHIVPVSQARTLNSALNSLKLCNQTMLVRCLFLCFLLKDFCPKCDQR